MTSVFSAYADYYDLLYEDKDYQAEALYVAHRVQKHDSGAQSLLELGCGTCRHAVHLASQGLHVIGLDRSTGMLEKAAKRLANESDAVRSRLELQLGDVRTARLNTSVEAVISLFHVFSYQLTAEDLQAALATAYAHLSPGGLLLFDYWYGPAVLSQGVDVRVKRVERNGYRLTRIAEPVLDAGANAVTVNYDVWYEEPQGTTLHISESHQMRYWFEPELEYFLRNAGFQHCETVGWMSDDRPSRSTFAAMTVARKI